MRHAIQPALGTERAAVLLDDGQGVMRFRAWRGLSDRYRRTVEGHSPWKRDAPDPQPVLVRDVLAEPSLAAFASLFQRERVGGPLPAAPVGRKVLLRSGEQALRDRVHLVLGG